MQSVADRPRIAVLGDSWKSLFAEYTSTVPEQGNGELLPSFRETAKDYVIEDGVVVATTLLQRMLVDRGSVHFAARTPSAIDRLMIVGPPPALAGEPTPPKRILMTRYLQTFGDRAATPRGVPEPEALTTNSCRYALVVDDGGEWRRSDGACLDAVDDDPTSRVFVVLGSGLPVADRPGERLFQESAWSSLVESNRWVCVVVSSSLLRHSRGHISRRLSWDRTIQDLCYEIASDPGLSLLHRHANLIVRFGHSGAAFIQQACCENAIFVFEPYLPHRTQRDSERQGRVFGKSTIVAASVLRTLIAGDSNGHRNDSPVSSIEAGLQMGLRLIGKRFRLGYLAEPDANDHASASNNGCTAHDATPPTGLDQESTANRILGPPLFEPTDDGPLKYSLTRLPNEKWERRNAEWTILSETVPPIPGPKTISRINLAEAIVLAGFEQVLNRRAHSSVTSGSYYDPMVERVLSRQTFRTEKEDLIGEHHVPKEFDLLEPSNGVDVPTIDVPILTIGKFSSIERHEIECVRAVRNLMAEYITNAPPTSRVPLSVAVFGPPGSGKSFAVKQMAEDLQNETEGSDRGQQVAIREFNLAQFQSPRELSDVFSCIRDDNICGRIPIVFIDEFDCELDSRYGWLKYLLAPMQDGLYKTDRSVIETGRAILVFAGGTASTFREFASGQMTRRSESDEEALARFTRAKGPDFVSRLRGFIDVASLNPTARDGEASPKPVIRRALLLRSLMEQSRRVRKISGWKSALIDEDIVFGLLTVGRYQHEARSLQAIVEMCTPLQDRITKASLPSDEQLSMHLDADEFHLRIARSRRRPQAWVL